MKIRLTNVHITSLLTTHVEQVIAGTAGRRASLQAALEKVTVLAEPLLDIIQIELDRVNGRAAARVIRSAREILAIAIEVEFDLRSKGVTIENLVGTEVSYYRGAGFKGVSTSFGLVRGFTGWFVQNIEKNYSERTRHTIAITSLARQQILLKQTRNYREISQPSRKNWRGRAVIHLSDVRERAHL